MTIATLYNAPLNEDGFAEFSLANADHHFLVRNAIFTQKNVLLTLYPLDPVAEFDIQNWLQRHQQAHFDVNNTLGTPSNDLSDLNFKDPREVDAWAQLHASEHIAWAELLRVF